ncbi:MAG: PsbP-related protein [Nitrosotalea sp.]
MDARIIAVSLFLLLVSFVPNSLAVSQNSTLDSQGNYANTSLGIIFQAPQGWTVQEPKKYQPNAPDVAIIAPYSNGFSSSISVNVEKANGTSLDDYVKNKITQLTSTNQPNNIALLSEQDGTVDGISAKTLLFQENFTLQNNSNVIKFKQAITLTNDNFYTITYANEEKNFDSDLPSYAQLLDSIKFVNNNTFSWLDYVSVGIVAGALIVGMVIIKRKRKPLQKN